uniref:Uncharacterized protein n=1 Tax=Anguilla anguilla TaxID=7936 RepID=A0A0E9SRP4_ANGAN
MEIIWMIHGVAIEAWFHSVSSTHYMFIYIEKYLSLGCLMWYSAHMQIKCGSKF